MAVRPSAQGPSIVLASADPVLRRRLAESLRPMRWQVREAAGGAEALALFEAHIPDALLLDPWLPDLDVRELAESIRALYPGVDLLRIDSGPMPGCRPSARRNELLHALRELHAENAAAAAVSFAATPVANETPPLVPKLASSAEAIPAASAAPHGPPSTPIEGMVGEGAAMRELVHLIRLVGPRNTTVLIEGETGTGKELVAQALHRLSPRAGRPFAVLNCAAIPETLLEAELFGHTRGAFTGAVAARTGRIEAAHGGSLLLDEIGEMPLALQPKLLRFLECGEIQRVGDNETLHVDVRVIAATHQPLETRAGEGRFRLDLYHRLAVFPIEVPPLRERREDIPALARHFLATLARTGPAKRLTPAALEMLVAHPWPGNIRELAHVLERATILAGDAPLLEPTHIRVRRSHRS